MDVIVDLIELEFPDKIKQSDFFEFFKDINEP